MQDISEGWHAGFVLDMRAVECMRWSAEKIGEKSVERESWRREEMIVKYII